MPSDRRPSSVLRPPNLQAVNAPAVELPSDHTLVLKVMPMPSDANANGETDRKDGGGASGNPRVTVWDFIFGRKPSPKQTAVHVGQGVTEISVTMMYLSGTSLKPLSETKR